MMVVYLNNIVMIFDPLAPPNTHNKKTPSFQGIGGIMSNMVSITLRLKSESKQSRASIVLDVCAPR